LSHVRGYCLDIGCGNNRLINIYRASGGKGIGIDVYPWEGVDMVLQDTRKLPFKADTFDTVTFVASLNHIPYREEVLKEVKRVLKRESLSLITTLSPLISFIWHKYTFWDRDQHKRGMQSLWIQKERTNRLALKVWF